MWLYLFLFVHNIFLVMQKLSPSKFLRYFLLRCMSQEVKWHFAWKTEAHSTSHVREDR